MPDLRDLASFFSLAGKTAVVMDGSRGLGLHAASVRLFNLNVRSVFNLVR